VHGSASTRHCELRDHPILRAADTVHHASRFTTACGMRALIGAPGSCSLVATYYKSTTAYGTYRTANMKTAARIQEIHHTPSARTQRPPIEGNDRNMFRLSGDLCQDPQRPPPSLALGPTRNRVRKISAPKYSVLNTQAPIGGL